MISPFLTTNIFLINLAVMLITTSITGGIVTLVWLAIGRWLEKMGYVNIVFELMKLSTFFFFCPVGYIFLYFYPCRKYCGVGIDLKRKVYWEEEYGCFEKFLDKVLCSTGDVSYTEESW